MRPDFTADADKNEEDIFSDEVLDREKMDVTSLLHTHWGTIRNDDVDGSRDEKTNYMHSRDAMQRTSRMWAEETPNRISAVHPNKNNNRHRKYSDEEIAQLKMETLL